MGNTEMGGQERRRRSRKGVKERKRGKWTERGGREKTNRRSGEREGRGEEEKWRGKRGREEEGRSVLISPECPKFRPYLFTSSEKCSTL